MNKMIIFLILVLVASTLYFMPLQKQENEGQENQGARLVLSTATGLGLSENQTDVQEISWVVEITNSGAKTAENAKAEVILYPQVASRLETFNAPTVQLGDLTPNTSIGFKGNATFNSTGLSKQDIDTWGQLVKIKVTWAEDGKTNEIIP
jgi:hypothetical protein